MEYGSGAIFGCPAHNQRDLEFALNYGLEILPVVCPANKNPENFAIEDQAYVGDGKIINSDFLNGLNIEEAKNKYPDVNILVHPECTNEVVSQADYVGSTEYIKNVIETAEKGSSWAIGTEINLVKRLAHTFTDKNIFCLDEMVCPCATMYRVHPAYLLWVLEGLVAGIMINQITVSKEDQKFSKISLQRMLDLPK